MASPDGSDLVAIVVAEVAKQVPVKEVLSPAASEIGGLGSDLIKCVRLALAPIQYLAVQQDRFRRFIEASAERVAEQDRVTPAPQLLGPILEGIRYEPEGSGTDEAFSELLSRAFDRERVSQAHPAFPALIRALADDELILLRRLRANAYGFKIAAGHSSGGTFYDCDPSVYLEEFSYLTSPIYTKAYANHLEALGLIMTLIAEADPMGPDAQTGVFDMTFRVRLSDFGWLFTSAVLGNNHDQP